MDGLRFDRIARRLAQGPLSRRAALRASGLGVAAVMVRHVRPAVPADHGGDEQVNLVGTPTAQSTPDACPTAATGEVEIDGAWLCHQPYALCTTAACQPSPHDPATAICRCFVEEGYSIGYTSCDSRRPVGEALVSTFSTQNVTSQFGVMICPASARWANCLDAPCQRDPANPGEAICPCPIVERGPSMAFGGQCDLSTCSSVIWSAASPPGVTQYPAAMRCVNQPVTFPATCPGATPVASPGGTPVSG